MKARLRKPVEGLEVGTIYDIKVHGGDMDCISVQVLDFKDTPDWIDYCWQVRDLKELFDEWEIPQPVSDTTKQAIHSLVGNAFERGFQMGNTGWKQKEYDGTKNTLEADILEIKQTISEAVVGVLAGEQ